MTQHRRPAVRAADVAAVAGITHGAASIYWACGGTWLISTLGHTVVAAFSDRLWLLWPVALVKLAAAIAPAILLRRTAPPEGPIRWALWAASLALIAWGGLNTALGNLVLSHAVRPSGGYDRDAMIGHAWLWDPLFLLWGASLAIALTCSRPTARRQRRRASISRRT